MRCWIAEVKLKTDDIDLVGSRPLRMIQFDVRTRSSRSLCKVIGNATASCLAPAGVMPHARSMTIVSAARLRSLTDHRKDGRAAFISREGFEIADLCFSKHAIFDSGSRINVPSDFVVDARKLRQIPHKTGNQGWDVLGMRKVIEHFVRTKRPNRLR